MADVGACHTVDTRGMQGVLPCLPGTVNAGAHNTVDAQRHVGELYHTCLVWELMAPTILYGKMSAPTTLLRFCHARQVSGYYLAGAQGTVPGIAG